MQADGVEHELQIKDKSGIIVKYGLRDNALTIKLKEKEGSEITKLIVITSKKWTVETKQS